ncbi:hypothetical protein ACIA8O_02120 [Kitasatospora sp. NPDC051853]|uniref:hypothetical protein n=1 Tax=Kitasatospora sp. NPDC051853 TaxID=3364058 RepID=UPI0037BCA77D
MTPLLRPARCLRAGAALLALAAVLPLTTAQLAEAADRHGQRPLPGHATLHGAPVHRSAPLQ